MWIFYRYFDDFIYILSNIIIIYFIYIYFRHIIHRANFFIHLHTYQKKFYILVCSTKSCVLLQKEQSMVFPSLLSLDTLSKQKCADMEVFLGPQKTHYKSQKIKNCKKNDTKNWNFATIFLYLNPIVWPFFLWWVHL